MNMLNRLIERGTQKLHQWGKGWLIRCNVVVVSVTAVVVVFNKVFGIITFLRMKCARFLFGLWMTYRRCDFNATAPPPPYQKKMKFVDFNVTSNRVSKQKHCFKTNTKTKKEKKKEKE